MLAVTSVVTFSGFVPAASATIPEEVGQSNMNGEEDSYKPGIESFGVSAQTKDTVVLNAILTTESYSDTIRLYQRDVEKGEGYTLVHEVPKEEMEFVFGRYTVYQHAVTGLEPGRKYEFSIKIVVGDTEPYSHVIAATTLTSDPRIVAFSKKNALRGEYVTIYGENLGEENWSENTRVSYLGDTGNPFYVTGGNDKSISVSLPFDIDYRRGFIEVSKTFAEYPYSMLKDDGEKREHELYHIVSKENLNIINESHWIERTIDSHYYGEEYRYLINSLDYRYGRGEVDREYLVKEQRAAKEFREIMQKRLGRDIGVDALWFLNLFQAWYYGGYSEQDIENEVLYGPGVVHTTIQKKEWEKTVDYQNRGY